MHDIAIASWRSIGASGSAKILSYDGACQAKLGLELQESLYPAAKSQCGRWVGGVGDVATVRGRYRRTEVDRHGNRLK